MSKTSNDLVGNTVVSVVIFLAWVVVSVLLAINTINSKIESWWYRKRYY